MSPIMRACSVWPVTRLESLTHVENVSNVNPSADKVRFLLLEIITISPNKLQKIRNRIMFEQAFMISQYELEFRAFITSIMQNENR